MGHAGSLSTVAVKEFGQQRLERQEGNTNQARHSMRAIQNRMVLHIKQHEATLSSEEEEEEGEPHEGRVELARGLAGEFNLAFAVADLPSKVSAKGSHGRQDDPPIGVDIGLMAVN